MPLSVPDSLLIRNSDTTDVFEKFIILWLNVNI